MPNNDALIALRLTVQGVEQLDKASQALDRTAKAKAQLTKDPGYINVIGRFQWDSSQIAKAEADLRRIHTIAVDLIQKLNTLEELPAGIPSTLVNRVSAARQNLIAIRGADAALSQTIPGVGGYDSARIGYIQSQLNQLRSAGYRVGQFAGTEESGAAISRQLANLSPRVYGAALSVNIAAALAAGGVSPFYAKEIARYPFPRNPEMNLQRMMEIRRMEEFDPARLPITGESDAGIMALVARTRGQARMQAIATTARVAEFPFEEDIDPSANQSMWRRFINFMRTNPSRGGFAGGYRDPLTGRFTKTPPIGSEAWWAANPGMRGAKSRVDLGGAPPGVVPPGGGGSEEEPEEPGRRGSSLFGRFGRRFAGLGYYMASAAIIYPIAASIFQALDRANQLEVIMRRIQGIYGGHTLSEQLEIKQDVIMAAQKYSENINSLAEAAQQFAQEQVPLSQLPGFLQATAIGAKGFGLEPTQVADYIIALQNSTGGQINPMQAMNTVAALASRFAVSPTALMTVGQRITPMLEPFTQPTGSLNETTFLQGITGFVQQRSRLSGDRISAMLQYFLTRFGQPGVVQRIQDLSGVGLGTAESGGTQLRDIINIFRDLSEAYKTLGGTQQKELANLLFGARSGSAGGIALGNFQEIITTILQAERDQGAALRMANVQQDAYNSAIQRLHNSLQELVTNLQPVKTGLVSTLGDLVSSFGGFVAWLRSHSLGNVDVSSGVTGNLGGVLPPNHVTILPGTAGARYNAMRARAFAYRRTHPTLGRFLTSVTLGDYLEPEVDATAIRRDNPTRIEESWVVQRARELANNDIMNARKLGMVEGSGVRSIGALMRRGMSQARKGGELAPEDALTLQLQEIQDQKAEQSLINLNTYYDQILEVQTEIAKLNKQDSEEGSTALETLRTKLMILGQNLDEAQKELDIRTNVLSIEAQLTMQNEKQLELLKQKNEIAKMLDKTIVGGLITGLPEELARQRGGLTGSTANEKFGLALLVSVLQPFGTAFSQQVVSKSNLFGPNGALSGVTNTISNRIFGIRPLTSEQIQANVALQRAGEGVVGSSRSTASQLALPIGTFVGNTAGAAFGGNAQGAQAGSAIGGILGGLTPLGPVGAGIGAAIGGLLGGFLGGKPNQPPQIPELKIIADNSREQVRLIENTNRLLQNNFMSFNVPTGFRLPAYTPGSFGGGAVGGRVSGGGSIINVSVAVGSTTMGAGQIGTSVAQAISDRLELESRSSGSYVPRLVY